MANPEVDTSWIRTFPAGPVANPKRKSTNVQTLLFPVGTYTTAKAKAWAKKHGYKSGYVDTTDNYHRIRQREPGSYQEGSLRTIEFGKGIKAVVGRPKAGRTKVAAKAKKNPTPAIRAFSKAMGHNYTTRELASEAIGAYGWKTGFDGFPKYLGDPAPSRNQWNRAKMLKLADWIDTNGGLRDHPFRDALRIEAETLKANPKKKGRGLGWSAEAKAERRDILAPVFQAARAVVKARKKGGSVAQEAKAYPYMVGLVTAAEAAGVPAGKISRAVLKEAGTRQSGLFAKRNPRGIVGKRVSLSAVGKRAGREGYHTLPSNAQGCVVEEAHGKVLVEFTLGGRTGKQWLARRDVKVAHKKNPLAGPLTITHDGPDLIIRHTATHANPKKRNPSAAYRWFTPALTERARAIPQRNGTRYSPFSLKAEDTRYRAGYSDGSKGEAPAPNRTEAYALGYVAGRLDIGRAPLGLLDRAKRGY